MKRDSLAVFDGYQFIRDALSYAKRHGMSRRTLLAAADIDLSSGLGILRCDRAPTLLAACALASVCDLSLDEYRRTVEASA